MANNKFLSVSFDQTPNSSYFLDFGKFEQSALVAQLSKLAFGRTHSRNQDRILGYEQIYQSQVRACTFEEIG